MHTLSTPRRIPFDDSFHRPLRELLVAVALLMSIGVVASGNQPAAPDGAAVHRQTVQSAGTALGAQTLELSSQDWPMVCLSCSTIV